MKQLVLAISIAVGFAQAEVALAAAPLLDLGAEMKQSKSKPKTPSKPVMKKMEAPKKSVQTKAVETKQVVAKEIQKDMPPAEWGYFGDVAPKHWGDLDHRYQQCKTGKNQSPVDLRDARAVGTNGLPELDVFYRETDMKMINTGHSIQVNYPLGSYIKIAGHRYELMHLEFHTPSEHQKDGFSYPMEVQMVHKDGDGNQVIIATIFQEGEFNETMQTVVDHLPKDLEKEHVHKGVKLNPVKFFPKNTKFYKYSGSLTTPPCNEGVYWMVFKQTIEVSLEQINAMNELMGDNARPVQNANSRSILKSWAVMPQENQMYEFY